MAADQHRRNYLLVLSPSISWWYRKYGGSGIEMVNEKRRKIVQRNHIRYNTGGVMMKKRAIISVGGIGEISMAATAAAAAKSASA